MSLLPRNQGTGGIQGPQYPTTQYPNTYSSGAMNSYLSRYRPQNTRYGPYGGAMPTKTPMGGWSMGGSGGATFKEAYSPALEQQAEDYGNIMHGYQGILSGGGLAGNPEYGNLRQKYLDLLNKSPYQDVNAQSYDYSRTGEVNTAFDTLGEYARTGGLSEGEIGNLRARGVSPVRSTYANMMREMDRNRSLQGGYSPNFAASAAKMAREQSDRMAGALTDVNAGIAEMQQKGRLAMAPQYANLAEGENALRANIGLQNAEMLNRTALANAANRSDWDRLQLGALGGLQGLLQAPDDQRLAALQGMTSLYGTTPALINEFGQQMQQAAALKQNAKAQNQATGNNLISQYMSRYSPYNRPVYG